MCIDVHCLTFAKSNGFHLRVDKCQVRWPFAPANEDKSGYPREVLQEYWDETRVIQAPVGDLASVEHMFMGPEKEAHDLFDTIADLPDAHVAFFLLRSCFGSCRLAYTLRCITPEASLRAATLYDHKVEDCLRGFLGGVLPQEVFQEL